MNNTFRITTWVRRVLLPAAALVTVLMAALPSAAVGQYDCPSGKFCSWKNSSFGGSRFDTTMDQNSLIPYGFHDNISSAFNRSSNTFSLDQHIDCDGLYQAFGAGVADAQVNRNDDASSIDDWTEIACS